MLLKIVPDLTTRNILSRISSYDIFKRYCPNFKEIGKKFSERDDDTKPSCSIDYYGGDLLYKDFGRPGSHRAISYVAFRLNVPYIEAMKVINKDFELGLGTSFDSSTVKVKDPIRDPDLISDVPLINDDPVVIKIKRKEWTTRDLAYWYSYGWSLDLLTRAKIYPISHFWLTNTRKGYKDFKVIVKPEDLAYSYDYYFHNDIFRRKLYFPLDDKIRFISNVDHTIVQGYPLLPKSGELLFITSSMKDIGPFINLGFSAIAPNSESEFFYPEYVKKLKSRWKEIIIWFDNDSAGIKWGEYFAYTYDLRWTCNPQDAPKDPSDYVKTLGLEEFKLLIDANRLFYTG
jgi:hypothetical protein